MIRLALFMLLAFTTQFITAQVTRSSYDKATVVWYGLDFTQAKMVGTAGFNDPQAIKNDYFDKWNGLVLAEPEKYDIKGAFKKADMKVDVDMIKAVNAKVDYTKLVQDNPYTITKEAVQASVKQYTGEQKDGYGIAFVVESFDKNTEMATIWVTIFDAQTKNVLLAERVTGKAGGFGFRNYWAAAVANVIEASGKKFKSWVK